jgi:hypothetical protein
MAVTALEIHSCAPYLGGAPFGEAGPYERLDGSIYFAVAPDHPANAGIVDLDLAPRDADGRVHFNADFCLLRPADPARGNRRLLLDVNNRGGKTVPGGFNRAPREPVPTERIDPGDGFLFRRGWTVVWCGWQWDVPRSPARMGLEAPAALADGRPIPGQVAVTFQPAAPIRDRLLSDGTGGRIHQPYPAADVDDPDAVLTVRDYPDAPRTIIPRDRWRFARDEDGRPVPDDSHVWMAEKFEPGRFYEVVYRTRICPVVGTGLLAVRDAASFLRYGDDADNPCAGRIDRAFAYGASQSGRFLRNFLYLGLNTDEQDRQVFDGILAHIAGGRRGEFNHRYAQPSVQYTLSFGHLMPFSPDEQTDPLTGRTDGLLSRQRARGGVPRIFFTNTAAEYWRGDCSLLHTDLTGTRDVEPPPEVRVYHFAGTQHGSGALPLTSVSALDGTRGMHCFNTIDYSPLVRAALVNLERWATAGEEPPPSTFPRLADGTAVRREEVLDTFRTIPAATVPRPERLRTVRRLDLGPDAARGIGRYPAKMGEPYPTLVSAVDADGNETAGVRLPDVAVPLATHTGWNPRHPESGGEGQIMDMMGSAIPFPATAEERRRMGDPRPAIDERYRDRDDYLARVRAAATELVRQRYVLAEDVDLIVDLAGSRYDAFRKV